jgi:hypothetical protein
MSRCRDGPAETLRARGEIGSACEPETDTRG